MPRTASTSLFHILGQHPGFFRPFRKEVGYFLFNNHRPEQWYLDAFTGAAPEQRCIDVTPEYFFSPRAAERMAAFGDGVKVIIGVRNPASFAQSLHAEYGKRYHMPPLEKFVEHYTYSRGSERIEFSLVSGVIRAMLGLYCRTFGARTLLYDFSAFRANPLAIMKTIEAFVGAGTYFTPETFRNIHLNRGDRGTSRWLSALLSAEPLIDVASRVLPSSAMRRIARHIYRGGRKANRPPIEEPPPLPWLLDALREDERFIQQLFSGSPVYIAG